MSGMHSVFVMYAPIIGVCFIAASLVKDRGVAEKDASAAERQAVAGNVEEPGRTVEEKRLGDVAA